MTTEVFRRTMGPETDEELAASLKAIDEAMADRDAGRTVSLQDAKGRLDL